MNNLKRVLSLGLTGAMLSGMMLVGASAANKDFTDYSEITHTEAVNTLATLNVLNGKDTGAFDPKGSLTRAEMSKLIVYILHGGEEPVLGTKATPTFTDIKGNWAEKYIEYCASNGNIAGVGDGTFAPDDTLTASQAAKMLMVAMNYKSDIFQFTGIDWEINVNREANAAGLYNKLTGLNPSVAISRDDAAQMVYNAILAKTMRLTWNQNNSTGEITQGYQLTGDSLFSDKFDGVVYEGVLKGSGKMDPYSSGKAGKDKIAVAVDCIDGEDQVAADTSIKYTEDVTHMIGEYVKVLYNDNDKIAYGVYAEDEQNLVVETTVGGLGAIAATDDDVKIGDVTYDFANVASRIPAYATTGTLNAATWTSGKMLDDTTTAGYDNRNNSYVKLVDNTGDGKIDVAFIINEGIVDVNYVGSDKMTFSTLGSVKNADMTITDDATLAVDDKVIVTPKCASFDGTYGITKAETVQGKVDQVKTGTVGGTPSTVTSVLIDGEWYKLAATATNADLAVAGSVITDDKSGAIILSSTYKLYLSGSYAYAADIITSGGTEIGVITGVTTNKDFDNNTQLRMMKSDGTEVTAYMKWDTGYTAAFANGQLVTYTVSNGIYTLYPAGNTYGDAQQDLKAMGGYDVATGIGTNPTLATDSPVATGTAFTNVSSVRKINGVKIDDGAVVFVEYDSNTGKAGIQSAWKVYSGKEVNAWKSNYGAAGGGLYKTSGLGYLGVAVITAVDGMATPGASSTYAYVTSDVAKGSDYVTYSIWDGTSDESITVTEKNSSSSVTKGSVIGYDWDGDSEIKNVSVISNRGALTYTNGNQVKINGVAYDLADAADRTILNVDTDKKVGVSGTAISKAQMTMAQDVYYNNVAYKLNSDGEIEVLVVDVINNLWKGAGVYNTASIPASTGGTNSQTALTITLGVKLYTVNAGTITPLTGTTNAVGGYFNNPGTGSVTSANYDETTDTITLVLSSSADSDTLTTQPSSGSSLCFSDGTLFTVNYTYESANTLWK